MSTTAKARPEGSTSIAQTQIPKAPGAHIVYNYLGLEVPIQGPVSGLSIYYIEVHGAFGDENDVLLGHILRSQRLHVTL